MITNEEMVGGGVTTGIVQLGFRKNERKNERLKNESICKHDGGRRGRGWGDGGGEGERRGWGTNCGESTH